MHDHISVKIILIYMQRILFTFQICNKRMQKILQIFFFLAICVGFVVNSVLVFVVDPSVGALRCETIDLPRFAAQHLVLFVRLDCAEACDAKLEVLASGRQVVWQGNATRYYVTAFDVPSAYDKYQWTFCGTFLYSPTFTFMPHITKNSAEKCSEK